MSVPARPRPIRPASSVTTLLAGILAGCALLTGASAAGAPAIDHVEPPFWWTGMHDRRLQLMVHGPARADREPALA